MPSVPPAPARFSTTTGWPSRAASPAATRRPSRSLDPPGGKGTTSLIGRVGKAGCASAGRATAPSASPIAPRRPMRAAVSFVVISSFPLKAEQPRGIAAEAAPADLVGIEGQRLELLDALAERAHGIGTREQQ